MIFLFVSSLGLRGGSSSAVVTHPVVDGYGNIPCLEPWWGQVDSCSYPPTFSPFSLWPILNWTTMGSFHMRALFNPHHTPCWLLSQWPQPKWTGPTQGYEYRRQHFWGPPNVLFAHLSAASCYLVIASLLTKYVLWITILHKSQSLALNLVIAQMPTEWRNTSMK